MLERIDQIHVLQCLDWHTSDGKRSIVRASRERALFSHIWNATLDKGYIAKSNPCVGACGFEERRREV